MSQPQPSHWPALLELVQPALPQKRQNKQSGKGEKSSGLTTLRESTHQPSNWRLLQAERKINEEATEAGAAPERIALQPGDPDAIKAKTAEGIAPEKLMSTADALLCTNLPYQAGKAIRRFAAGSPARRPGARARRRLAGRNRRRP